MLLALFQQKEGTKYTEVSNPSPCQHCPLCNITVPVEIILFPHQHSYAAKSLKLKPPSLFQEDVFALSSLAAIAVLGQHMMSPTREAGYTQ